MSRVAAALVLLCGVARADDPPSEVHIAEIVAESLVVFGIPTAYYWSTKEHQAVDWTLDWDWESWKAKLLSTEKLKLDTNPFHVNALRHPFIGVLDYQIARTNGLDAITSMLFGYATGVLWEFFIEYREDPSINDMLENGVGGIAIGEPLYRIGQLWRGTDPSLLDRAHTLLFSPWDAVHDTYRARHAVRPRAWRSIVVGAGSAARWSGDDVDRELSLDVDIDVVTHAPFVAPGAVSGPIAAGAWSRVHASAGFGGADTGMLPARTLVQTRTTFAGSYQRSAGGTGTLAAISTAFTYRYDRFAGERDRLGIFHLAGPQLQLAVRRPDHAVWIDLASYGDFALVDPLAVGSRAGLAPPPPYFSSIQSDGYYYAAGFSVFGRVRAATGAWQLDAEIEGHQLWQIDGHSIHNEDLADGRPISELTITGLDDLRLFGRAKLGYRPSRWGIALTFDGAYRRGDRRSEPTRTTGDLATGLVVQVDY